MSTIKCQFIHIMSTVSENGSPNLWKCLLLPKSVKMSTLSKMSENVYLFQTLKMSTSSKISEHVYVFQKLWKCLPLPKWVRESYLCRSVARHLESGQCDRLLRLQDQLHIVGGAREERVDPTWQQGSRKVHLEYCRYHNIQDCRYRKMHNFARHGEKKIGFVSNPIVTISNHLCEQILSIKAMWCRNE